MVSTFWPATSTSARCISRSSGASASISSRSHRPHVGGDLVVARAAGVQALARVADQLRQARLDVQVHVLEVELPFEAPGLDLLVDLRHAAADRVEVGGGDDALRGEHVGMRQRAGDVGLPQPAVERHAGRVALDQLAHRLGEQRGPGL
jgi:hypothetical protein